MYSKEGDGMDKSLIGHVMCTGDIKKQFKGCQVVVIDPVYEGAALSVGRVVAALRDGETSIYEGRHGSLILDLRGGGKDG